MTLKKRILLGYGVAFALMSIVVGWATANLVSLGRASGSILRENYRSILASQHMVYALERQDSGVLLAIGGATESGVRQFHESEAVFLEWLGRAKDNITIPDEADIVQSIDSGYGEYRRALLDLIGSHIESELWLEDGRELYRDSLQPLFNRVRLACIRLHDLNEATMYAASERAGRVARRATWSTALVASSALVAGLLFSVFLTERIARPLRRFVEATQRISTGDYAVQMPIEGGDELGRLAHEFNQMASQLGRYHEVNIENIIAEQKKSEAILSSIEDGLVVFDTGLRVISINPAARRILHLESAEGTALDHLDVLDPPRVREMIRTTLEHGAQPSLPDEQRIIVVSSGADTRQYLLSATPIRKSNQELAGVVVLLRDVTGLREVERLKSEFVMAASHELRTPLTSLGMSIDLLLERANHDQSECNRELLQVAHEEVHRMQALVSDLLDLSRIEAGRIDLEFDRVPIRPLFERVQAIFRGQLEKKHISLTTRLAGDLPGIRADGSKITWVLTNLVSNAVRYVKEGGHIELAAQRIGPHAHVTVQDDGPGIPVEYQGRVFEKFVQVDGREPGGSGLGLAICKEIVRAHGGTIWVESSPDRGSTFTFTVPLAA